MIYYRCSSCGFKTDDTSKLIKGRGGCVSCGKSDFKCPRCGLFVKIIKTTEPRRDNINQEVAVTPKRSVYETRKSKTTR